MALRSTSSAQASATSITVTLPAGAAVGDLCYFFVGAAFNYTVFPTGWTNITFNTGATWNHATFYKVLVSGDISLGTVGATAAGSYEICGACACFIGAPAQREFQDGSGTSPQTLSCTGAVISSDIGVYWGSARNGGNAIVITPGAGSATLQQGNHQTDVAYALYTQNMPGGVQTNSYAVLAVTPAYSFQVIVEAGGAGANMMIARGLEAMGNYGQLKGGING